MKLSRVSNTLPPDTKVTQENEKKAEKNTTDSRDDNGAHDVLIVGFSSTFVGGIRQNIGERVDSEHARLGLTSQGIAHSTLIPEMMKH